MDNLAIRKQRVAGRTSTGLLAVCVLAMSALAAPAQTLSTLDTNALVTALRINDSSRAVLAELKARGEAGDGLAAYRAGDAYRTGLGSEPDLEQARDWYLRAVDPGGLVWANAAVGDVILQLSGNTPAGVDAALPYWRTSAEAGTPAGLLRLAEYDPRFFGRLIQTGLTNRGYDVGPIDGIIGPATRETVLLYIENEGLGEQCGGGDWITFPCLNAMRLAGLLRPSDSQ